MQFRTVGCFLLLLILLVACAPEEGEERDEAMSLKGKWNGEINIPNQPLAIEINLEDEQSGTISIPIQGVTDYPLSTVELTKEQNVIITMKLQGQLLTFEGKVKGEEMTGTFTQNGQQFPFDLVKGEKKEKSEDEEEGEFLSINTDNGILYGELETPTSAGPYPVMLIIPGSGPTDRNGNSPAFPGKNDSLKLLAEELAENGIASVRYDKRGAGKNQQAVIEEASTRYDHFVQDAQGWLDLLANDSSYTKIGIIGHSQGSLTGILAAQTSSVDALISLAGAGRSMDEVLCDQLEEQISGDLLEESKAIIEELIEGKTSQNVSDELQSVFRPAIQPFLTSWMKYTPADELAKLSIPTLIIQGEHDLQVKQQEAAILQEAKPDAEMVTIDKMNHVLKEAPAERRENIQTYGDPALPIAAGLMEEIMGFLKGHQFISE